MPRIELAERFIDDMLQVSSPKVEDHIWQSVANVAQFPEMGLTYVRDSIKEKYGEGIRQLSINPFNLLYTYYPDDDLVRVEALIHQRSVR